LIIFVGGNDEREAWVWAFEWTSPYSGWGRITGWNNRCSPDAGAWNTRRFAQACGMLLWIQYEIGQLDRKTVWSNCLNYSYLSGRIPWFLQEAAASWTCNDQWHSSRGGFPHVWFCFALPQQPWYEKGQNKGVNSL